MTEEQKKGVIIFDQAQKALELLPPEQFKNTMVALFQYNRTEEQPEHLEPIEQIVFNLAREGIDWSKRKYRERCEQNRRNVNSRYGKIEKNEENASERPETAQTVYDRIPSNTNEYERVLKEKEKEKENENDSSPCLSVIQEQSKGQTDTTDRAEHEEIIPTIERAIVYGTRVLHCSEEVVKKWYKDNNERYHFANVRKGMPWTDSLADYVARDNEEQKRNQAGMTQDTQEHSFIQDEFLDLAMKRSFKDQAPVI